MTPRQFAPERIARDDVQALMKRVEVRPASSYTHRVPDQMPSKVKVTVDGVETFDAERSDYDGFHTRPMSWVDLVAKFDGLAEGHADAGEIVQVVRDIERRDVAGLMRLLAEVR